MYKRGLAIIILILISLPAFAQITNDAKGIEKIDVETYELFNKAKWEQLTELGNRALEAGIDFYYLRMRIGIAYYNQRNYMSSISHFKSALEFIPKEPAALEYLYWALVFSGLEREARVLASEMPEKLRDGIGAKPDRVIHDFYAEGGLMYNGDNIAAPYGNRGSDTIIYAEQKPDKNSTYLSVNLNIIPFSRMTIFQGYNNINISSKKSFASLGNAPENYELNTRQNEYYLNAGVYAGKGFAISGILHYLNIGVDDVNASVNTTTGGITYTKTSSTLNNYVGLLSIEKSWGHFKFLLNNSYSNLNYSKQIQNSVTVAYFPTGNLDFYSVTDLVLHSDKPDSIKGNRTEYLTRGIVKQKFGAKVAEKLWVEAFYMFGNAENYHEDNAFVVFNSANVMYNRLGINIISPITQNISLSLRYQYYKQDVSELVYETSTSYKIEEKTNSFHKIIGGIKWTF